MDSTALASADRNYFDASTSLRLEHGWGMTYAQWQWVLGLWHSRLSRHL